MSVERVTASADAVNISLGDTPSRSFSSVRSRISFGDVSSINATSGSISAGYLTRCSCGMTMSPGLIAFRLVPFGSSMISVPVGVAQDAAGQCAGMLLVLEQYLAVDDRMGDALRGLLDAPAASREVVHDLLLAA